MSEDHKHDWKHVLHEGHTVAVRCSICHLTPYEVLERKEFKGPRKTPKTPGADTEGLW